MGKHPHKFTKSREKYFEDSARGVNLQEGTDYNITNETYTVKFSLSSKINALTLKPTIL